MAIDPAKVTQFWESVDRNAGPAACWPWLGWKDDTGRGRFRLNGHTTSAPRAALIIKAGEPEKPELQACHSCDNPECCNPSHLRWDTRSENMREMGRKGRAGIQRYPERYKRKRRPDVKYRPVKQSNAEPGIDHRTATRYSTSEEQDLAREGIRDLEQHQNRIVLIPAPQPSFDGHKIRMVESRNPDWYIKFGEKFWPNPRAFTLKRARVVKALERVVKGRVRGNGYEKDLLECLKEERKKREAGKRD